MGGEDMVIPDEVWNAAYLAGERAEAQAFIYDGARGGPALHAAFLKDAAPVIARWARDEALKEAETAVRPSYRFESVTGGTDDPIQRANWSLHHAADRIRLLRGVS